LITDGIGYYQEKNRPRQVVRKGDVIKCLPGVAHWHGASPENRVNYIATTLAQKGKTIWLKRVSNEEYNAIQQKQDASFLSNKNGIGWQKKMQSP
jgi:NCAIR mutase (PurE)-related protein